MDAERAHIAFDVDAPLFGDAIAFDADADDLGREHLLRKGPQAHFDGLPLLDRAGARLIDIGQCPYRAGLDQREDRITRFDDRSKFLVSLDHQRVEGGDQRVLIENGLLVVVLRSGIGQQCLCHLDVAFGHQHVGLRHLLIALRFLSHLRRRHTTFDQLLLAQIGREPLREDGPRLGDVRFCLLDRGLGAENSSLGSCDLCLLLRGVQSRKNGALH